ncbi:MAG: ABC transporter permease [Chthoniobacteraceae bacterium]
MLSYIIRRLLYAIPIVFGVMVITFVLFFVVQSPRTMAQRVLGPKATDQAVQDWLANRGYDKPLFFNTEKDGKLFDSLFFNQMAKLATFDLGKSDVTGRSLATLFKEGAIPSLLITVPAFITGFIVAVAISLYLVFVRNSLLDLWGILLCVALMSIPVMVYVIFGQYLMAVSFKYFPAFGFQQEGLSTIRFLLLPVALMVVSGLGAEVRIYRAIFLEEIGQDYIRTARAKGLSNTRLLLTHVLKNGMINIITLVVASLPFLIMGSLVLENFFGIPGLGNLIFTAIQTADFAVVRSSVFLGALMYLAGFILTDICYALVDPRIRLS